MATVTHKTNRIDRLAREELGSASDANRAQHHPMERRAASNPSAPSGPG